MRKLQKIPSLHYKHMYKFKLHVHIKKGRVFLNLISKFTNYNIAKIEKLTNPWPQPPPLRVALDSLTLERTAPIHLVNLTQFQNPVYLTAPLSSQMHKIANYRI